MSLSTIAGLPITRVSNQPLHFNMLVYGESGAGKGHPHGTNILTPNGWTKIEDLIIGDLVIDANGNFVPITGLYQRGVLKVHEVVFNDGSSVMVDDEHLWISRTNDHQFRNQPWLIVDTAFIRSTLHRQWRIPMVEPIKFNQKELPIDPYILGELIGNAYNKFIPKDYLLSSIEDRIALLRGLMDADGELTFKEDVGSVISYSTTSAHLADDFEFLIQSLGGTVTRSVRAEPNYMYKDEIRTSKPSHRLCICLPEGIYPFETRTDYGSPTKYLPNRTIISILPTAIDAEVICISVNSPTNTYVTEHCIVTHNTTLAGSSDAIPEMRKVLILDIEGGTLSLKNRFPNIESLRIKNWADMQKVYDELYLGEHGYCTIVIDSLTEAQKMSMDTVMRRLVEENAERDADVPGIREWNINIEQTRKFVRSFRDLPVNTIFTALSKSDKNMQTGITRRKPSLSGKVADEVAGFLDIVVYLYTKEVDGANRRMLLCGSTENTVAKDRTDKLPQVIQDPTMSTIWNAVKGLTSDDNAVES